MAKEGHVRKPAVGSNRIQQRNVLDFGCVMVIVFPLKLDFTSVQCLPPIVVT